MSPRPQSTLEDFLREMLPEEWLRQTAKETGLIVHERETDPVRLSQNSNCFYNWIMSKVDFKSK